MKHSDVGANVGEPTDERDPIAVFGLDGIVEGWIPKFHGRISDGLNDADRMRFRAAGPDGAPGDWVDVSLEGVMAVAAPPQPPTAARLPRRRHAVELDAGPYHVQGTVHVPPGAHPDLYLDSRPRKWLPLTDCTVAAGDDEWAVDVVIVNLAHAQRSTDSYRPPPFG